MNFFEAQEFFKQMYPGKEIKYEFDNFCHRTNEFIFTDGKPNLVHHIEHRKVKVTVDGMEPFYVPISPHRETYALADMKKMLLEKFALGDIHINQQQIDELKALEPAEFESACAQLAKYADLSVEKIKEKLK